MEIEYSEVLRELEKNKADRKALENELNIAKEGFAMQIVGGLGEQIKGGVITPHPIKKPFKMKFKEWWKRHFSPQRDSTYIHDLSM